MAPCLVEAGMWPLVGVKETKPAFAYVWFMFWRKSTEEEFD